MSDYVIDFTIPQGPTGATGTKGATGGTGPTGATGVLSSAYNVSYETTPKEESIEYSNVMGTDKSFMINKDGVAYNLANAGSYKQVFENGVYAVSYTVLVQPLKSGSLGFKVKVGNGDVAGSNLIYDITSADVSAGKSYLYCNTVLAKTSAGLGIFVSAYTNNTTASSSTTDTMTFRILSSSVTAFKIADINN